jgi:benzodiazapine receptor
MLPSRQVIAFPVFVLGCLAAGWLGSLPTRPAIPTWYAHLLKPQWTPPDWVFAPVWTALYLAMGVAAWLVWRRAGFSFPLLLFLVQLALNVAWSGIFFGLRMPGAALVEVLLLWGAILATVLAFWPFSRAACVLMVLYLLWVTYAAALNAAIRRLNS